MRKTVKVEQRRVQPGQVRREERTRRWRCKCKTTWKRQDSMPLFMTMRVDLENINFIPSEGESNCASYGIRSSKGGGRTYDVDRFCAPVWVRSEVSKPSNKVTSHTWMGPNEFWAWHVYTPASSVRTWRNRSWFKTPFSYWPSPVGSFVGKRRVSFHQVTTGRGRPVALQGNSTGWPIWAITWRVPAWIWAGAVEVCQIFLKLKFDEMTESDM